MRLPFGRRLLCQDSTSVGESLSLFYPIQDEGYKCDTISQRIFGVAVE